MGKCTIQGYAFNTKAKIPTKTKEAAGFDVYTIEDEVELKPHSQHLFSTGLGYIIKGNYGLMAFDRGSTGSKGLHVHCGVCDKDYRGEIFICIKNDNPYAVKFSSKEEPGMKDGYLVYPTSKAIAQLIPVEMPDVSVIPCGALEGEIACKESKRGDGKLGSSGK